MGEVQAKQGRLREEEAKKYFQQLINAVDYCHNKGVYHRDLKVSFVIFEFNLTTKITLEKKNSLIQIEFNSCS